MSAKNAPVTTKPKLRHDFDSRLQRARKIARMIIRDLGIDPDNWENVPFEDVCGHDGPTFLPGEDESDAFEKVLDYGEAGYFVGLAVGMSLKDGAR